MLNPRMQSDRQAPIRVEIDESLKHLIPGFLENRRKDIEKIRLALGQAEFPTIQTLGHRMKGDGGGTDSTASATSELPWNWPRPGATETVLSGNSQNWLSTSIGSTSPTWPSLARVSCFQLQSGGDLPTGQILVCSGANGQMVALIRRRRL